jgi:Glycosyltransferase family 87
VAAAVDVEPSSRPTEGPRPGAVAAGRIVIVLVAVAVLVEVLRVGGGVDGIEVASSWQLLDLDVLEHDPLRGVWFLHTQPPLHNLVIGLVASSPLPLAGTLFLLYAGCVVVLGLVLHDLLLRWDLPNVVATAVACLAVANPALLSTVRIASYEVPLATVLVVLVWVLDRYLDAPTPVLLGAIVGLATALVLTRSLFHPVWLVAVLAVVFWARRQPARRVVAFAAVPLVLIGGLVVKNAALFDSPTLSSWTGFNLHRGVLDPMSAASIDRAVDAGRITGLAAERPWQNLADYRPWLDGCRSGSSHAAVAEETKSIDSVAVPNFNHECYLRLYRQSQDDALTMIFREPDQYARGRVVAVALSHAYVPLGEDDPGTSILGAEFPSTTWMDRLYSLVMVRSGVTVDMSGWNVPLVGARLSFSVAWLLVLGTVLAVVATVVAAVGCWRAVRRHVPPARRDVVWLVAGFTILFVVLGGDLVELGENFRFRSMLDPLVLALGVSVVADLVARARRWRRLAPDG